jgi:hypothetical protein
MDGTMARKRHKPEEIVAKLQQVDVPTGQGRLSRSQTHSGRNGGGLNRSLQHTRRSLRKVQSG